MNTKISIPLLLQPLLETTAGREALYRLIQFSIRFLSPISRTQHGKVIYFLLSKISWNIGITRHINRFGLLYKIITSLVPSSLLSFSSQTQVSNDHSDYLKLVSSSCFALYCLMDHLILLSKIQVFTSVPISKLYYTSGVFWFVGNTSTIISYLKANKSKPLNKKETFNLLKCLCDYVILFHFSTKEKVIPNWLCGLSGVISSSLSIYSKYIIKD